MTNPYAVPSHFTVQLKPCCREVLLGEECDCPAVQADPGATYPTPLVLEPAGNGLLKRAEATS